jgi:hypothetical protein
VRVAWAAHDEAVLAWPFSSVTMTWDSPVVAEVIRNGHAREAPHASGLRLHELEVAAADLLGDRGRGVGRDVLGGALAVTCVTKVVVPQVSLGCPGLPDGDGAQRDDGVAPAASR